MAQVAPLDAIVSVRALRLSAGLCNISADVVIPAPASQLHDAPMVGMALARGAAEPLGAHRVLLLICGTEATDCDSVDPSLPMPEHCCLKNTFKKAKCLLSESEPASTVTLVGYSDFKKKHAGIPPGHGDSCRLGFGSGWERCGWSHRSRNGCHC